MKQQVSVLPQQWPRLRLDFYNTAPSAGSGQAVLMSRWQDDGRVTTYPVSIHDVVGACTHVALSSGLLPPNTLFWQQQANQPRLGIYVPARQWRVQTEERSYHLPMPPFVFVGSGSSYQIFAVKKRPALPGDPGRVSQEPSAEQTRLYHAPCPNVHAYGGICQGNTPFPTASPGNIQNALTLFMEGSLFNGDLSQGKCQSHPDDVRGLWAELNGRKRFPLSELVPAQMVLGNLL